MRKGSYHTAETRERLRVKSLGNIAHLGHKHSPETIKRMRLMKLGKKPTLETREKMSEAQKGEKHHRYGKVQSEEIRANVSKGLKEFYQTAEGKVVREKINSSNKGNTHHLGHKHSPEALEKLRIIKTGKVFSEDTKKKMSETGRNKWQQVEHRNKLVQAQREALHIFPNRPETMLLELLNEVNPDEWAFVGDGKLVICGRNPDFTNVNGKKAVVLLHGVYWHLWKKQKDNPELTKEQVEEEDKNFYKVYGWACLIVWDDELKDTASVKEKIKEFAGRG